MAFGRGGSSPPFRIGPKELRVDGAGPACMTTAQQQDQEQDLPLDLEIESPNDYSRRIKVAVDADTVAAVRQRKLADLRRVKRIRGFRPGKAPARLVEERFGSEADQRVVQDLVNRGLRQAFKRHELRVLGDPDVRDVDFEPAGPLAFTATVQVEPNPELARLGGFRLRKQPVEVRPELVDRYLEAIREENAVLEPADRAPQLGDVVCVVIKEAQTAPAGQGSGARGPTRGKKGKKRKKARNANARRTQVNPRPYEFTLGSGQAIPDVEAAIQTLQPGQAGVFEVGYPDDYQGGRLVGQSRSLRIELRQTSRKILPELDDDLARAGGKFESFEELKSAVEDAVRAAAERSSRDRYREELVDAVIQANPFQLPPGLIAASAARLLPPEEAEDREAAAAAWKTAERELKRNLVLDRIVTDQQLQPSNADLDQIILETFGDKQDPATTRRRLAREGRLDDLRHQVEEQRALEYLESRSRPR